VELDYTYGWDPDSSSISSGESVLAESQVCLRIAEHIWSGGYVVELCVNLRLARPGLLRKSFQMSVALLPVNPWEQKFAGPRLRERYNRKRDPTIRRK
jgi:hypothetical protein